MARCKVGKALPWLSINGDRDPRVLFWTHFRQTLKKNSYSSATLPSL